MQPYRLFIIILLLLPMSFILGQQQYPEVIDTTWPVGNDKIRHLVKKLQTNFQPPARERIAPGGEFRCAWNKPLVLPSLQSVQMTHWK